MKHYFVWRNKSKAYLCNQACGITKEKATRDRKEITCKNCLHKLQKGIK